MRFTRCIVTMTAVLLATGCSDARDPLAPTAADLAAREQAERSASAARRVPVSGDFDALVDFTTLTLTPRGRNCVLEVAGRLVFSGTIAGTAVGRTTALVFAPCSQVATTPPGTYRDVFRSRLVFTGTVGGVPARANVLYQGGVEPGGAIDARLIFSNGVAGSLEADAVVAVGGTYRGALVVR